ncbi:TRAP transporter small permease [Cucumibacter marinus]|uniref:TRAP transporter small permease n=1 Tax=Cucumibacter marinus TaxID=1121252 RepID=UPI0003F981A2|nr:TRAP transporter small permease [Cucumibacter marinus]
MSAIDNTDERAGLVGLARRLITWWALAGGFLLMAIVVMSTVSVTGGATIGRTFPGDFELVQMGVAISVFAFLPYAQLTGANVTADIFTSGLPPRGVAVLTILATVGAIIFMAVMTRQTWLGMFDYIKYPETTAILSIPIWYAFVPIIISLVLLLLAQVITLFDAATTVRKG